MSQSMADSQAKQFDKCFNCFSTFDIDRDEGRKKCSFCMKPTHISCIDITVSNNLHCLDYFNNQYSFPFQGVTNSNLKFAFNRSKFFFPVYGPFQRLPFFDSYLLYDKHYNFVFSIFVLFGYCLRCKRFKSYLFFFLIVHKYCNYKLPIVPFSLDYLKQLHK